MKFLLGPGLFSGAFWLVSGSVSQSVCHTLWSINMTGKSCDFNRRYIFKWLFFYDHVSYFFVINLPDSSWWWFQGIYMEFQTKTTKCLKPPSMDHMFKKHLELQKKQFEILVSLQNLDDSQIINEKKLCFTISIHLKLVV